MVHLRTKHEHKILITLTIRNSDRDAGLDGKVAPPSSSAGKFSAGHHPVDLGL